MVCNGWSVAFLMKRVIFKFFLVDSTYHDLLFRWILFTASKVAWFLLKSGECHCPCHFSLQSIKVCQFEMFRALLQRLDLSPHCSLESNHWIQKQLFKHFWELLLHCIQILSNSLMLNVNSLHLHLNLISHMMLLPAL